MKRILVISFSDLRNDPRVNRQIRLLARSYQVTAAGYADPEIDGVLFVKVDQVKDSLPRKITNALYLIFRLYSRYYWSISYVKSAKQKLTNMDYDLIVANDINALPLSLQLAEIKNAKLVYDAHEYSPRQFEDQLQWRLLFKSLNDWQCRKYLPKVDGMLTVGQGIADEYEKNYGVKPVVIPNASTYHDLKPLDIDKDRIKMIYHGGAIRSRRLEMMIDVVKKLDVKYYFDMLLVGDPGYIGELKDKSKDCSRIRVLPPVDMEELPYFTNKYDIGIYLLPPENFNQKMALPNKLFEYIQARLAVVIGPSPEMASIVRQYDCGVVSEEFTTESFLECFKVIDVKKLNHYKKQSDKAARELSFEAVSQKLLDLIDEIFVTSEAT